ncbi:MAG: hypothetical protein ACLRWQ_12940 [Flavonifractor plautii]
MRPRTRAGTRCCGLESAEPLPAGTNLEAALSAYHACIDPPGRGGGNSCPSPPSGHNPDLHWAELRRPCPSSRRRSGPGLRIGDGGPPREELSQIYGPSAAALRKRYERARKKLALALSESELMNRRRSFHSGHQRRSAFSRPSLRSNTRGRPIRRTWRAEELRRIRLKSAPWRHSSCAVRPAESRRGGGGLFRAWRYFAPPAPERQADRVGARPPGFTPHRGGGGGGHSNFMLLLLSDPGGRRAYRSRGIADHQQYGSEVTVDGHYFGRATDYQLSPDGKTIYICYENTGALTETSILGKAPPSRPMEWP